MYLSIYISYFDAIIKVLLFQFLSSLLMCKKMIINMLTLDSVVLLHCIIGSDSVFVDFNRISLYNYVIY